MEKNDYDSVVEFKKSLGDIRELVDKCKQAYKEVIQRINLLYFNYEIEAKDLLNFYSPETARILVRNGTLGSFKVKIC